MEKLIYFKPWRPLRSQTLFMKEISSTSFELFAFPIPNPPTPDPYKMLIKPGARGQIATGVEMKIEIGCNFKIVNSEKNKYTGIVIEEIHSSNYENPEFNQFVHFTLCVVNTSNKNVYITRGQIIADLIIQKTSFYHEWQTIKQILDDC